MEKEQLNNLLGEIIKVRLLAPDLKKMTYNDLLRRRDVYEVTKNQDKDRYDELEAEGFTEKDAEMQKLLIHIKKLDDLQNELDIIENVVREMPLHELNRKIEVYNTRKNILIERKEELEAEGYKKGDKELDEVNNELFSVNELLDVSNKLKQLLPNNMFIEISTPASTPTTPVSTPTRPASTPTTPVSTPTRPASTPTTPVSTPTRPASTPTTPVSTPTRPASTPTTPTTPASTPTTPVKAKIKGIKIGKQIEIEYENADKNKVRINFKKMKNLMKQSSEQKEKMLRKALENTKFRNISKDTLKLIDPNVIYAFQNAKKHKVDEKGVEEDILSYVLALKGDKDAQDKLQGLITYDRTDMDYWKPSTFFQKLFNRKQYKQLDQYANNAKEFSNIIFDLPGKIRMALGKKDTKLLTKAKENTTDRNKRISENATQQLSGNSRRAETSVREEVKVDKDTAEKLRKIEEEFGKSGTVRDNVKSDIYRKIEEKMSKQDGSR